MGQPVGDHHARHVSETATAQRGGLQGKDFDQTDRTEVGSPFLDLCRRISTSRAFNAATGPVFSLVFFWSLLGEFHSLSYILHLPEGHQYNARFFAWFFATVSKIIFLSLIITLLLIRRAPVTKAKGLQPRITAVVGTFMVALIAFLPADEPTLAQSIAGMALIAVGSVLSAVVISYLGQSFSIMAEARELVTRGPYSLVRHPLYVAEEIAVAGAVVINFSLPVLLFLMVHIGFQIQRARNEEVVLSETFPRYQSYSQRTPRFIPGVY